MKGPGRKAGARPRGSARSAPRGAGRGRSGRRSAGGGRGLTTAVGLGTSAGGLQALSELLAALPPVEGMALVVVQHLSPDHDSILPSLLAESTAMPVVAAEEGMALEGGRVHVITPNTHLEVRDGVLHLGPRPLGELRHRPIDVLFASLAAAYGSNAIGVVLSGTASDGAQGLREIKAAGGIALVQDPESASFDGMPRAALLAAAVDRVLAPAELAVELARIAEHPYLRRPATAGGAGEEAEPGDDRQMRRVFALLQRTTGVDFRNYKAATITRRLQRRMVLNRVTDLDRYVAFLERNPGEVEALFRDILIHVTRFFREAESYRELGERVFPQLLETRGPDEALRIWVAGCATGEEVYSVAITLLEACGEGHVPVPAQIFGTDLSEEAVAVARGGVYPESIAADVSAERLRRHFTRVDGRYRVSKTLREMCVFARQDITADPPFSHLDLVLCRNVLIYLNAAQQRRVTAVFHYALKPAGFLMLGAAETVGQQAELFHAVDRRHRLFRKVGEAAGLPHVGRRRAQPGALGPRRLARAGRGDGPMTRRVEQLLLDRFAPPAVLVDGENRVVQTRGQLGDFLALPQGDVSLDVLKLARGGLVHPLRTCLLEARQEDRPARREGLRRPDDGRRIDLEVVPVHVEDQERYLLVLFAEGAERGADEAPGDAPPEEEAASDGRIVQLQQELAANREYMRSMIQDLEAANEELQSANEEILSANEELQSTNEELDTAKEELQSSNEELNTLNDELHNRNEELSRANSDLVNLLGSVQITIVIVDTELRVRRFTPMAGRTLNLIASDVGRPIRQIKPEIDCPDLEALIGRVIDQVGPLEREVRDRQGRWYSLRIRPYKSLDNRIDGAVVALLDINEMKRHELDLQRAYDTADAVLEVARAPLLVLDSELRILRYNRALRSFLGVSGHDLVGRSVFAVDQAVLGGPAVRRLLEDELPRGTDGEPVRLDHRSPGRPPIRLEARRIPGGEGRAPLVLLALAPQPEAEPSAEATPED